MRKINEHARAIDDFSAALALNPAFVKAYNNRGNAYADLQQRGSALQDYCAALAVDPGYTDALYNRGLEYSAVRDDDRAVQDFTLVLHHNPEDALALGARALIHLRLGRTQEALVDFSKALECAPDSASLYYNRGLAYAEQGCLHEAIDDYTRCLGLEPHNAEAWNNRGAAYAVRGRTIIRLFVISTGRLQLNRAMPMLLKIALRPSGSAGVISCTEKCGQEVRYVSNRTGKRDIIRTLGSMKISMNFSARATAKILLLSLHVRMRSPLAVCLKTHSLAPIRLK